MTKNWLGKVSKQKYTMLHGKFKSLCCTMKKEPNMLTKQSLPSLLIYLVAIAIPGESKKIRVIYQEAKQLVVLILTYDAKDVSLTIGSGFFAEKDKLISNYHVIDGAAKALMRTIGSESQHDVKETVSHSESLS